MKYLLYSTVLTTLALAGCSSDSSQPTDAAVAPDSESVATETLSLVGTVPITGLPIHDVWAYTNPSDNKQYALIGASEEGMRIVDVTDREAPVQVGSISGDGVAVTDVKTWLNYAYTVGEGNGVTGTILDLSDPAMPVKVGTFPVAHNLWITDGGFLLLAAPGLRVFDLANPLVPTEVFNDPSCRGHDITVVENRLYEFSDNCGTRIFDITDPASPQLLGAVEDSSIFHHSGWPSADGNYLYITDELAAPEASDITVWDIRDLSAPTMVGSYSDPDSYVHNIYVVGNYAYVSYYRAGFRVFDISDPTQITLADEFDTSPGMSGPGFGGNFGVYPFNSDGAIFVSDETNGLFIFTFDGK